eukprot:CAMPEP_0197476418 /NCGR_PEP_ID=MMETSP1309-20131121/7699_1 /TAXON_ID=464262 /ORGANISM="Genus nov. species nov., Strain RCC998" /LENGTH=42 /DNA_ID= /DNA_START= /DNA_END= /DNA_ORIENTATION=
MGRVDEEKEFPANMQPVTQEEIKKLQKIEKDEQSVRGTMLKR